MSSVPKVPPSEAACNCGQNSGNRMITVLKTYGLRSRGACNCDKITDIVKKTFEQLNILRHPPSSSPPSINPPKPGQKAVSVAPSAPPAQGNQIYLPKQLNPPPSSSSIDPPKSEMSVLPSAHPASGKCVCGLNSAAINNKIINGEEANPHEFPFQARASNKCSRIFYNHEEGPY